jgi:L-ascorbate metabolism protein UlaG (beta-lactamase superfamily)
LWSRRRTEPALAPHQLPRLDAVVLSHLHGDHFDRVARAELDRDPPVFTTPQAARRLHDWGFRTVPLEPWQVTELTDGDETLRLTCLPAVHARGWLGHLLPPVMGSMLELDRQGVTRRRVYLSGDTLTGDHVDAIFRRFPAIDAAVVHLGGTRVLLHTVTLDDRQGVDLVRRLDPGRVIPVHHSDYRVFRSPLSDFVERAEEEGLSPRVSPVDPGSSVPLAPIGR